MLDNNTNKVVWVGVAVGLVAVIGAGALTLFPDAFSGMKNTISLVMTTKANADKTQVTVDGVVDDYDTSNHDYTFDDTNKTAVIGSIKSGKDKDKGSVVVPSYVMKSGIKYTVVAIDTNAYRSCPELTDVAIPDTIKSIGYAAFYDNKLTSVTIPDSVTSIGNYAFQDNQLTSVTIPDSVTSIGNGVFYYNKLTSVSIPNSVTSIGHSAFEANQLTSVTIPNSVTSLGNGAFQYNKLTSVTIPNGVISIGSFAFANNYNLISVTIPDSVRNIGERAFYSNNLTSVTIPNSVTSLDSHAFDSSVKINC